MKLILASAFFISGIAVSAYAGYTPTWIAFWVIVSGVVVLVSASLFGNKTTIRSIAILVLIFMLGVARGTLVDSTDSLTVWHDAPEENTRILATGWLVQDVTPAENSYRLRLHVEFVKWADKTSDKPFLLDVYVQRVIGAEGFDRFKYGDRYRVAGNFQPYPEGAGAVGFISSNTVFLLQEKRGNPIRARIGEVREALSSQLARTLPQEIAGLAAAMSVGDRQRVTSEVLHNFRYSGLSHVLAISGLHVSVIGGILLAISAKVIGRHKYTYLLLPAVGVWGYATLAGMSPAVIRASAMFSIVLLAHLLGRQRNSLPSIGLVGSIMVGLDPSLLSKVSFQLSFAAVAGIIAFTPILTQWWRNRFASKQGRTVSAIGGIYTGIATSLGATVMTLPIIASTIGVTPLFSVIATVMVLPVVPLFVMSSIGASVLGSIWFEAGWIVSWVTWLSGWYITLVAKLFAGIPYGVILSDSTWPIWSILIWYLVLSVIYFRHHIRIASYALWINLKTLPGPIKVAPTWSVITILALCILSWSAVWNSTTSDKITIHFYQTSLGDMILVTSPNGSTVLIDGGESAREAAAALDKTLPFWKRSIDMVVLTHPDSDHLGGLTGVLERYKVGTIMDSAAVHNSALAREWQDLLNNVSAEVVIPERGMSVHMNGGGWFEVIWAEHIPDYPVNDASTVMMLRYKEFSLLLTGDITKDIEERLILEQGSNLRADFLKVAHHGSNTSSVEYFIDAVSPVAAIIQAGYKNRFGHPTPETIARLNTVIDSNYIWVTKDVGDVVITTDGKRTTVKLQPTDN